MIHLMHVGVDVFILVLSFTRVFAHMIGKATSHF